MSQATEPFGQTQMWMMTEQDITIVLKGQILHQRKEYCPSSLPVILPTGAQASKGRVVYLEDAKRRMPPERVSLQSCTVSA